MTDITATNPAPFRRPQAPSRTLSVVSARDITPRMRRVTLTGEDLKDFAFRPGQDLNISLPQPDGENARRHYTIRAFDPASARLDIDFVLHGESPAVRWVKGAQPGDTILAQGPRGRTVINPEADWHLFTGDETCLPGIFAMLESLPAGAKAYAVIEIAGPADEQALDARADVALTWIHRRGRAEPSSPALIAALADFEFPAGNGAAYVIGETSTVRAQRQGLIARGFPKERIAAEGYWRPGRVGGHDHVFDGEGMRRPG